MSEKYDEAALRHSEDAKILASKQRFDNAGHLIGFAAECAIKFAVNLPDEDRYNHLPKIAGLAKKALKKICGRNETPLLNLLNQTINSTQNQFFDDWRVDHRYSASGMVTREMYMKWNILADRTLLAAGLRSKNLKMEIQ